MVIEARPEYPKEVINALIERSDVTLVTNYTYEHVRYRLTIPAGAAATPGVLDEKNYAGFRRLAEAPLYFPTVTLP